MSRNCVRKTNATKTRSCCYPDMFIGYAGCSRIFKKKPPVPAEYALYSERGANRRPDHGSARAPGYPGRGRRHQASERAPEALGLGLRRVSPLQILEYGGALLPD